MFKLLSDYASPFDERGQLQLYTAYRELRMMAKRDSCGEIHPDDERWIHFDYINTFNKWKLASDNLRCLFDLISRPSIFNSLQKKFWPTFTDNSNHSFDKTILMQILFSPCSGWSVKQYEDHPQWYRSLSSWELIDVHVAYIVFFLLHTFAKSVQNARQKCNSTQLPRIQKSTWKCNLYTSKLKIYNQWKIVYNTRKSNSRLLNCRNFAD